MSGVSSHSGVVFTTAPCSYLFGELPNLRMTQNKEPVDGKNWDRASIFIVIQMQKTISKQAGMPIYISDNIFSCSKRCFYVWSAHSYL